MYILRRTKDDDCSNISIRTLGELIESLKF